ncbi:chorismate mutase [Candidatus Woesearchaeota archaeon]|nr:chorismate mutase [Candidatus Woesearchaeota archaeon]
MKSLSRIRNEIQKKDIAIVCKLVERSKFLINDEFYRKRNHPEFEQNSVLFSYIQRVYRPIIEMICPPGNERAEWEYLSGIDFRLVRAIMNRTELGFDVAHYKDPRGIPVYAPDVEEKKLKSFEEMVMEEDVDPSRIREAMQFIMKMTKRIQDIAMREMKTFPQSADPVSTYRTGVRRFQEILVRYADEEIKKLEGKYSIKKRKKGNIYLVEIHKI